MLHDKPLAADGLDSYRYKGRYGWIMVGALSVESALKEAARSTSEGIEEKNLQKWTGTEYAPLCRT